MRKSGFTLMELMIATGILAIVLLGLLAVFTKCFVLNELAGNLTAAINGAEAEMERMRSLSFDDIGDHPFEIAGIADADYKGVVEVTVADTNLLEVRLTVCWRQKGGQVIGEDSNLDGELATAEDSDHDGILDSPAQLATLIVRK